jgi:hypothetical protein
MAGEENGAHQAKTDALRKKDTFWGPAVLIIILASFVFLIVNGPLSNASDRESLTTESNFSSTALLSGVERRNSSSDFRGGQAEAVMGGVDLDLREATMQGAEAKIEVSAIMGGIELRVPRTWTVINRVVPILGGVNDHTSSRDANKRLVIEGTILMGGLEIKN